MGNYKNYIQSNNNMFGGVWDDSKKTD